MNTPIRRFFAPAAVFAVCLWPALFAGGARAQFCSASVPALSFGMVDVVSGSNYPSSASITVTCTMGLLTVGTLSYSICLGFPGASGSTLRSLSGTGSSSLGYNVYADSAYSTVWGTFGTTPGFPVPPNPVSLSTSSLLLGGSNSTTVPIYTYLQSSQNTSAVAGFYSQLLVGTVSYNFSYSTVGTPAAPPSCTGNGGTYSGGTFQLLTSATVINDCLVTTAPINFGNSVGILNSAVQANGSITLQCTNGDNYSVSLNKGSTTTGTDSVADRQMWSGSDVVHYQLYTNGSLSTVWGDGTLGTSVQSGVGNSQKTTLTVYGQVPAQTTPAANTYTDTITATVTY